MCAAWAATTNSYGQIRSRLRTVGRVNRSQYTSITAGLGFGGYFGDLCPTGDCLTNSKLQLNAGLRTRLNPWFTLRAELQYYSIGASDAKNGDLEPGHRRRERNLSFKANNIEVSLTGQLDFMQNSLFFERFSRRRPFNAYGFFGLGVTTNNPKATLNGVTYNLREKQTEGKQYSALQPVVPIGLGVRFKLNTNIDLLAEGGYRITFTDYLDDVSSAKYAPANTFNDPVALALSDRRVEGGYEAQPNAPRGNPNKKDSYYIFSAKIMYTFTENNFRGHRRGVRRPGKVRYPRYK
jgi:hypothetical protein